MMTNDSKDQGREAFEVLQVKGVLPLIQAMEKREREGTLPPDLQKAWNGFAIDGAPIATSASALARDEASVAQELRAGIAKEIEAQYELGAWNALEIAWSAIGELPDDLFCVSGKAAIRDAIKAIQEQYKS